MFVLVVGTPDGDVLIYELPRAQWESAAPAARRGPATPATMVRACLRRGDDAVATLTLLGTGPCRGGL